MKPILTIAIPTWDNTQQLNGCLSTLISYTRFPFKAMVIDNGCSDQMESDSAIWPKNVEYHNPGGNLGWMGGINHALERCDTPFFAMMNDDVVFTPNSGEFWSQLIGHFNEEEVGIVAPSSDFIAGTQSIAYITDLSYDVSVVMGVCLVLRTEFFKELGGLDESLPGGDDYDLCARVHQAEKTIRVDKRAFLHHIGQQSGRRKLGELYDSEWHQEVVKNAIAAKHGLKMWLKLSSFALAPSLLDRHAGEGDHEWLDSLKLDGMVLNLGCGAHKIEGAINIDINDSEIEGQGGMITQGTVAEEVLDVTDLPYEDAFADTIIASHLLEHLIDPLSALQEWRRVLKPGGDLILIVPDQARVNSQVMDPTHVHCYTANSLDRLLRICGFEVYLNEEGIFYSLRLCATVPQEVLV